MCTKQGNYVCDLLERKPNYNKKFYRKVSQKITKFVALLNIELTELYLITAVLYVMINNLRYFKCILYKFYSKLKYAY